MKHESSRVEKCHSFAFDGSVVFTAECQDIDFSANNRERPLNSQMNLGGLGQSPIKLLSAFAPFVRFSGNECLRGASDSA